MHQLSTATPPTRCGFVHLPPLQPSGERLARIVDLVEGWAAAFTAAADATSSPSGAP